MKAVCFTNRGKFQIMNIKEPGITCPDDVKIKVAYAGLCGDDIRVLRGDLGSFSEDHVMGDEMSGVITELSDNAYHAGYRVGDKVSGLARRTCGHCFYCVTGRSNACVNMMPDGMMREYAVLHYQQLCRIPNAMGLKEGCLLPLLATCISCIEKADIAIGNSVIIFGAGGTGLLLLQLAERKCATNITVVEPVESKRIVAQQLGAQHVIDPLNENVYGIASKLTGAIGYDTVIDASGSMTGFNDAISVVANLGTLVTLSIYHLDFKYSLDMLDFLWRQITIRAMRSPSPLQLPQAVSLLAQLKLDALTSKVFSIDEMDKAYKAFMTGLYPKILIDLNLG